MALGARAETFSGLAGIGDLMATCFSSASRNFQVGEQLGRGRVLAEILARMSQVAEGVETVKAVVHLAERHGVEMPISQQVSRVLDGSVSPAAAIEALMTRPLRSD